MGFQLADDNDSSSSSPKRHPSTTAPEQDEFSLNPKSDKESQDDWNEGFGPQVQESVFIADQYHGSRPTATAATSKSSYVTNSFPPFLMLISAALNVLFMLLIVFQLKGSIMDVQSLANVVSSYVLLTVVAQVCLLADAIIMCVKGNGFGLILWAIFLPIVYYFVRCKKNGDSSLMAVIIVLAMLVSGGIYFFSISSALPEFGDSGNDASSYDPVLNEQIGRLSTQTLSYGGQNYTYKAIIDANVVDPSYRMIPETKEVGKLLVISGDMATDTNKSIEIQINTDAFKIHQITVDSTVYSTESEINSILITLFANTRNN